MKLLVICNNLSLPYIRMSGVKAVILLKLEKYDAVLDFNSIPVLCFFLWIYKRIFRIRVYSIHLTVNETFIGKFFPLWLFNLVDKYIFTDSISYKKVGRTKNSIYCSVAFGFDKFLNLFHNIHEKNILFLGSLERRKGIDVLIDAMKLVKKQQD